MRKNLPLQKPATSRFQAANFRIKRKTTGAATTKRLFETSIITSGWFITGKLGVEHV
jgi:hypothetical protein